MDRGSLMDFLQTFVSQWNSALAVVVVLGALIFFHELGHFMMARILGIGVKTFSLGFGPKIFTIGKRKTKYSLSLIPLGGYVSLAGEEDENEKIEQSSQTTDELFLPTEKFSNRPPWHRLLVVLAGPVANILLAFFIYWGVSWVQGSTFLLPIIGTITENSPAEHVGLLPGDIITRIDGMPVSQWDQVAEYIAESQGNEVTITLSRDDKFLEFRLTPEEKSRTNLFGEKKPAWLIGISAQGDIETRPLSFLAASVTGLKKTWFSISFTCESLLKLFQKVVPLDSIGGPILIAQLVGQQANAGIIPLLLLTALISINLGVLNLLPIPILDGGHVVFLLLEMIFQRPISPFIKTVSMRIGIITLLSLMIFATWNDIMRLIS